MRVGETGLDGVFVKNGQYFIVEAKYHGTARLGTLANGVRQMSNDWVNTSNRVINAVQGNSSLAQTILASNYQRLLAEVAPDGTVVYRMLGGEGSSVTKLDIFVP